MNNDRFKFRGICSNGILRYGRLIQDEENSTAYYKDYSQRIGWITENGGHATIPVSNKTLSQCTGLKDMGDNLVYENDFIDSDGVLYHVVFIDSAFAAKPVMLDINGTIPLRILQPFCVVGTVHNYVGITNNKG
jgi:hypothetical protein